MSDHRLLRTIALSLVLSLCLPQGANAARDPDLLAGDIGQVLIPAIGLAMTYYYDDEQGRTQWFKHTGTVLAATEALKYSLGNTWLGPRPNGGGRGFPSGHTSAGCGGAFFIGERYGYKYGAPALAMAALTGYSRVDEGYHHWRDVVAGCALAYASARYFVTPGPTRLSILPQFGPRFAGIELNYAY